MDMSSSGRRTLFVPTKKFVLMAPEKPAKRLMAFPLQLVIDD